MEDQKIDSWMIEWFVFWDVVFGLPIQPAPHSQRRERGYYDWELPW